MASITYVKGLPTPAEELNSLGFTKFEMFLTAYTDVFHKAACETANHLRSCKSKDFKKSKWNTYLCQTYGLLSCHADGVIIFAEAAVRASIEHRKLHIETLKSKLKSALSWIATQEKKLSDSDKFYKKKKWQNSKTGCKFPLSCFIKHKHNDRRFIRRTNWQHLRFQIHHKKRYVYKLSKQIEYLETATIQTKIPRKQAFMVGRAKDSFGNQICQWDGSILKFRVPYCLESRFGKYVQTRLGDFNRNINRLPDYGPKTWHFYWKYEHWNAAVAFTPAPVERVSRHSAYGSIGIDMNPGSIGWAYVDKDGNLKHHGQIPLQMGLRSGKQNAQIVDACKQLAVLANTYACPVVCENLDFSTKKQQLRERGAKYARMLSGWAYSQFYKLLESILSNRGIYLMRVNPAYTSVIGLVKYARQYGLASDEAAAIAIARRGMRLSENLPGSVTAYLSVKDGKHVWSQWNQLNSLIKKSGINRHGVYAISNWGSLVKQQVEQSTQSKRSTKDDFLKDELTTPLQQSLKLCTDFPGVPFPL
jgi:IS605 OrfB family transposase